MLTYPQSELPPASPTSIISTRVVVTAALSASVASVVFYWLTAFRTITWWDSGEYSLAAITLGVPHPPGSLLGVLLGWIVTQLPLGVSKAVALNCFSGVLAAATVGMVCGVALSLVRRHSSADGATSSPVPAVLIGIVAAVASLTLSLGETLWTFAIRFTPYTLTPLLTILIVWALLRWWFEADRADSLRWLVVTAFLLGLDFSVHRTNLLLLPAMLVWILLRDPRILGSWRVWRFGVGSFIVGLAFHLITIPLSARSPAINMGDPSNWSRFWSYVTLQQYGGGMLINLWPRKAPFFSVQLVGYLKIFSDNFAYIGGGSVVLGVLPLFLGLIGLWLLWRRERRLAIGMIILFLFTSLVGVIYFNTPADFFRSMDRHYLPSLVIFTLWIIYGLIVLLSSAWKSRRQTSTILAAAVVALAIVCPLQQAVHNYAAVDSSGNYFARDFAYNCLTSLPKDAIVFVNGDNDTHPLVYVQAAEGVRPDVDILNVNLLNTPWYVRQILERRPSFPLRLSNAEIEQLRLLAWHDSTMAFAVRGTPEDFDLPSGTTLPDSLRLIVPPSVAGKYLLVSNWLILKMIGDNEWKRPLCFLVTVPLEAFGWLQPFTRFDGLYHRLVPISNAPMNSELLKKTLLHDCIYRGYNDPGVRIDPVSRMMAMNYYAGMLPLMTVQAASGDTLACAQTRTTMLKYLPPERLKWPDQIKDAVEQLCGPAGPKP